MSKTPPGQTPASCHALAEDLRGRAAKQATLAALASRDATRAAHESLARTFTREAARWDATAAELEQSA